MLRLPGEMWDRELPSVTTRRHSGQTPEDASERGRIFIANLPGYILDRVARSFEPPLRLLHAISEKGSHVLGAHAGEAGLGRLCKEAGFKSIRVAVRTSFNLVLEARA